MIRVHVEVVRNISNAAESKRNEKGVNKGNMLAPFIKKGGLK